MHKVSIIKPALQESAIAYAKDLLARCEAGEVVAVTALEEKPGGFYQVQTSGTNDRIRTAGPYLRPL